MNWPRDRARHERHRLPGALRARRSLFDQAGLVHDLEHLLGVEVDVISEGGLRDTDVAIREDATAL